MRLTSTLIVFLFLLAGACVWLAGDWPRRVNFPAVTRSGVEEAVRAGRAGVVREIAARRGGPARAGEELAVLGVDEDAILLRAARWALREAELAEEQAWRGSADGPRREVSRRMAETARRRAELAGLELRTDFLRVNAPADGFLQSWDRDLAPGVSVAEGQILGWVVGPRAEVVSGYLDMSLAGRIAVGGEVKFFPDSGEEAVPGRIVRVEASRPEELGDPELAAVLGAVRTAGGGLGLARPYAKIEIRLERALSRVGQTGTVWGWTKPESLLRRSLDWLRGLAIRESSF